MDDRDRACFNRAMAKYEALKERARCILLLVNGTEPDDNDVRGLIEIMISDRGPWHNTERED